MRPPRPHTQIEMPPKFRPAVHPSPSFARFCETRISSYKRCFSYRSLRSKPFRASSLRKFKRERKKKKVRTGRGRKETLDWSGVVALIDKYSINQLNQVCVTRIITFEFPDENGVGKFIESFLNKLLSHQGSKGFAFTLKTKQRLSLRRFFGLRFVGRNTNWFVLEKLAISPGLFEP